MSNDDINNMSEDELLEKIRNCMTHEMNVKCPECEKDLTMLILLERFGQDEVRCNSCEYPLIKKLDLGEIDPGYIND